MNKYSPEETRRLSIGWEALDTHDYDAHELFIDLFAKENRKSKRSVIAKLSIMKIYVSRPRVSKVTGAHPETKLQLQRRIEIKLGANEGELATLDKSSKLCLIKLLEFIK